MVLLSWRVVFGRLEGAARDREGAHDPNSMNTWLFAGIPNRTMAYLDRSQSSF